MAWSSSVDLPMPGSPPTRSAEPGTNPPPQTRSSSAIPVIRRASGALVPASATTSIFLPLPPPRPRGEGAGVASSTRLFQPPQDSQRPAHLG